MGEKEELPEDESLDDYLLFYVANVIRNLFEGLEIEKGKEGETPFINLSVFVDGLKKTGFKEYSERAIGERIKAVVEESEDFTQGEGTEEGKPDIKISGVLFESTWKWDEKKWMEMVHKVCPFLIMDTFKSCEKIVMGEHPDLDDKGKIAADVEFIAGYMKGNLEGIPEAVEKKLKGFGYGQIVKGLVWDTKKLGWWDHAELEKKRGKLYVVGDPKCKEVVARLEKFKYSEWPPAIFPVS